jgi:transcriptional regulator with XRE-family HTH domain
MSARTKKGTGKSKAGIKTYSNPLVDAFATRIKQWRQQEGRTLKVVAADTGLSMAILCEWEHGHRFPSVDHLQAIAEYTGISASAFLQLGKRGAKASRPRRK